MSSAEILQSQSKENCLQDEGQEEHKITTDIKPKVSSIAARRLAARKKGSTFAPLEKRNWLIHLLYVKKDYLRCMKLIDEQIEVTKSKCEYPLYVKGLILRSQGEVQNSLKLFQQCHQINPSNSDNMKQIGKSLILLGRHKSAIECYNASMKLNQEEKDWEISQALGVCYQFLKQPEKAEHHFNEALSLSRHVITFQLLSKLHLDNNEEEKAKKILEKGVQYFGENVELLTSLGLLHLKHDDFHKAFEFLGKSLTYDPENYKAILAAGSLMQKHGDFDVALSKYRAAAQTSPESSSLWNNIAMCFYGKKKLVAAISCLKRARYLSPFDWKILYNLSLLHLSMEQYASSFQFASAAITLKRDNGSLYMLLAVSLVHLGQQRNALQAFQQAVKLSSDDPHVLVNFASFLHDDLQENSQAAQLLTRFKKIRKETAPDRDVCEVALKLMVALNMTSEEEGKKKKRKQNKDSTTKSKEPEVSSAAVSHESESAAMPE